MLEPIDSLGECKIDPQGGALFSMGVAFRNAGRGFLVLFRLLSIASGGCASKYEAAGPDASNVADCVAGASRACTCDGLKDSRRTCLPEGKFGPCECGASDTPQPSADAGTQIPADADSSPPSPAPLAYVGEKCSAIKDVLEMKSGATYPVTVNLSGATHDATSTSSPVPTLGPDKVVRVRPQAGGTCRLILGDVTDSRNGGSDIVIYVRKGCPGLADLRSGNWKAADAITADFRFPCTANDDYFFYIDSTADTGLSEIEALVGVD
jgi:hypothetical protein